jgi:prevent-host-death family protein
VLSSAEHTSHSRYDRYMPREITQRELRNDSGEIMRALDQGESFVVTRNGTPVGELIPLRRRRFVSAEVVMGAFAGAPRIDSARFRADVDSVLDQDPTPRAWGRKAGGRRAIDLLIAATALAQGIPLFTCNPAGFQDLDNPIEIVPVEPE